MWKMKISYSFGIIDFLHFGHIQMLKKAKIDSNYHIFGIVDEKSAKEWIGVLISSFEERKKVLEGIRYIDEVILQTGMNPIKNLLNIHEKYPNSEIEIYCDEKSAVTIPEEFLKKINGKLNIVEYYEKMAPENIAETLKNKEKKQKKYGNIISTKANTLLSLKSRLKLSKIEDIYIVTEEEYTKNNLKVLKEISQKYNKKKIVVRSSCSNEDNYKSSNAGHYDSFLNIDSNNIGEVEKAIEDVFESYKKDIKNIDKEQVLIQEQTENVKISGVIFTRDINYNRPFYLINYDDNGSTDSVTSGSGGKSLYISYDSKEEELPEAWKRLIESVKEIQNLLKGLVLDIEFAVNDKGEVIIFQVRPLAANYKFKDNLDDDEKFFELKNKNRNKYLTLENMFEENNIILSDMAFWNPSEIIGSNSKPLDYSLYREIITSSSWNKGLVPLGYKEADKDLMYKLGNKPYISVDDSFYSLIPNQISENISKKLVEFYKEKLKKNLKLHDKIEFEIVLSCYDFNTENSLSELLQNNFCDSEILEIKEALFNLTKESMKNYFKTLKKDLKDLDKLKKVREKVENKLEKKDYVFYIKCIKELLNSLNNYGTPHFSRQARYAFIAKSICKSLIDNGYASEEEIEKFMLSIRTIATEFKEDFDLYLNGELSRKEFDDKYGHLRSGTYDIRTDRYDKLEFNISKKETQKRSYKEERIVDFSFKNKLKDLNFGIAPEEFIEILRKCIENREYFKYEFTKSLSLVIEIIILLGEELKISRNRLSYLELNDIYSIELYNKKEEAKEFAELIIAERKNRYDLNSKLIFPEVITKDKDLDFIEISESKPNFITNKKLIGDIVLLEEDINQDISGKIVVISKADPGFDWIFAKNISGLITKYGGVASHMSIRCAEFGIPAAIGCGDKIYDFICNCQKIVLDCRNERMYDEI